MNEYSGAGGEKVEDRGAPEADWILSCAAAGVFPGVWRRRLTAKESVSV